MIVALIFNIEFQLLSIEKIIEENGLETIIGINNVLMLKREIKNVSEITNYILQLLGKYRKAHLDIDYEKYRAELYGTYVDYDLNSYHLVIDNLGEDFLKEHGLNYKIVK